MAGFIMGSVDLTYPIAFVDFFWSECCHCAHLFIDMPAREEHDMQSTGALIMDCKLFLPLFTILQQLMLLVSGLKVDNLTTRLQGSTRLGRISPPIQATTPIVV